MADPKITVMVMIEGFNDTDGAGFVSMDVESGDNVVAKTELVALEAARSAVNNWTMRRVNNG